MRLRDVLRSAGQGLAANRLRSALTTLGILIGVGSVILLVAVGNGSAKAIQASIERLGTNTLTVFSGGFGPQASSGSGLQSQDRSLTVQVAAALASSAGAPHIKSVSPVVTAQETATYLGASHSIGQLIGTYPSYFEASNSPVDRGTYFTNADVLAARKVVVIGQTVATDLFGTSVQAFDRAEKTMIQQLHWMAETLRDFMNPCKEGLSKIADLDTGTAEIIHENIPNN